LPLISFERVLETSTVSKRQRNALIDVTAERKPAAPGGFARDSVFRLSVLEAYAQTCCFCGRDFSVGDATAMEAAHVIPRGKRGADLVANGLCLCPVHHWAFDRGLWTLDEAKVIKVAARVMHEADSSVGWLVDFHGKSAHAAKVSSEALDWHRRNVFLDAENTDNLGTAPRLQKPLPNVEQ
jgi:putative restriction endonuclease